MPVPVLNSSSTLKHRSDCECIVCMAEHTLRADRAHDTFSAPVFMVLVINREIPVVRLLVFWIVHQVRGLTHAFGDTLHVAKESFLLV